MKHIVSCVHRRKQSVGPNSPTFWLEILVCSSMPRHSWEDEADEAASAVSEHSWESCADLESNCADSDCSDDSDFEENPSAEFLDYLTDLYLSRAISAKDFCTLAYWAGKAGVEKAKSFGCNPSAVWAFSTFSADQVAVLDGNRESIFVSCADLRQGHPRTE